MNFFKKKIILNPLHKPLHKENPEKYRRSFIRKSIAALFGATILTKAEEVFSLESKTGYKYAKRNGEIINNYKPSGDYVPFIGSIVIFGTYFPPQPNWVKCEGQLLSIAQYTNLFTLIGTTYGGNGTTNFAVPDFRGRVPIHVGQGAGLSNYVIGQTGGTAAVTLLESQIPAHNHIINASNGFGSSPNPSGKFLSGNTDGIDAYGISANAQLNEGAIALAGSGAAHNNLQPVLVMNYCIATEGIFPIQ